MLKWLEITPDYRCNNRCVGCFSVQDGGPSMSTREAVENLAIGRRRGATWAWIGGGEPTMRRDLLTIVKAARQLGYERIKLQTNGMMLSYPELTARCAEAGVTELNLSIKGSNAELHDRLTRTPGCHARMLEAITEARKRGLALEGDVLLYRSNMADLPAMIATYTPLGVARYNLWLLSVSDARDPEAAGEVPSFTELVPHITAAMDLGLSDRPDFITSLHTPPCTIPEAYRACLFHAPELGLLVTNPGGFRFPLEESPIEGGTYLEGCARCRFRDRCGGARADYVALHGTDELRPVE